MTKVVHSLNYSSERDSKREFNYEPSMTVQRHNLSLQELLERHTRGTMSFKSGTYMEGEEYDEFNEMDVSKMDRMEIEELKAGLKQFVSDKRRKLAQKAPALPAPPDAPTDEPEDLPGL